MNKLLAAFGLYLLCLIAGTANAEVQGKRPNVSPLHCWGKVSWERIWFSAQRELNGCRDSVFGRESSRYLLAKLAF